MSALKRSGRFTSAFEPTRVTEVDVGALPIETLCGGLVEPVTSDPEAGVNTAVRLAGDPAAANDVPQVTVTTGPDCAGVGTAPHPLIGVPPFSNATIPDGVTLLAREVMVATNGTLWFVTGSVLVVTAVSEVAVGAVWVRYAGVADTAGTIVMIGVTSGVCELVSVEVYVPFVFIGAGFGVNPMPVSPGANSMTEGGDAPVTVTVTVLVDTPSAGIDDGESERVALCADATPVLAPNETSSARAPSTKGRTAAI
jgi:hypothetical protein